MSSHSIPDAIKAYQRALVSSEAGENDIALRIGRLYSSLGNSDAAAAYHKRALLEGIRADHSKAELGAIRLWLARHEMREPEAGPSGVTTGGDLLAAQEYLKQVTGVAEFKEVANALLLKLVFMLDG